MFDARIVVGLFVLLVLTVVARFVYRARQKTRRANEAWERSHQARNDAHDSHTTQETVLLHLRPGQQVTYQGESYLVRPGAVISGGLRAECTRHRMQAASGRRSLWVDVQRTPGDLELWFVTELQNSSAALHFPKDLFYDGGTYVRIETSSEGELRDCRLASDGKNRIPRRLRVVTYQSTNPAEPFTQLRYEQLDGGKWVVSFARLFFPFDMAILATADS